MPDLVRSVAFKDVISILESWIEAKRDKRRHTTAATGQAETNKALQKWQGGWLGAVEGGIKAG